MIEEARFSRHRFTVGGATAMATIFLLSACNTNPSSLSAQLNSSVLSPALKEDSNARTRAAADVMLAAMNADAKEMENFSRNEDFRGRFPDKQIVTDVRSIPVAGGIDLEATYSLISGTATGVFAPSKYLISDAKSSDLGTRTFIKGITELLNRTAYDMRFKYGYDPELAVVCSGQADGLQPRGLGVRYSGQHEILMPAERTKVNGAPETIKISPNQPMSNIQLAAARAWHACQYARQVAQGPAREFQDFYEVTEAMTVGSAYRRVTLTMRIHVRDGSIPAS